MNHKKAVSMTTDFTTTYETFVTQCAYVMLCAIWYNLYNLKNVKKTHGGVLLLVKLQAKSLQLY